MKKLNILHVASFLGNIGDNANHTGFKKSLQRHLGGEVNIEYTEFEIRKVFWKEKAFDNDFVNLANKFDLVVIGGGNYFELWVEDSHTGTSFDMPLTLLSMIKVPIIFNALGVDPAQGVNEETIQKFRRFLDYAIDSPRIKLSCRNDGSIETLSNLIGEKYANAFYHVPDAGFFTEVKDFYHPEIDAEKNNILIQIAGDMIDTRFPDTSTDGISYDEFLNSMASYIEHMHKLNANFIFVPHIFRDLGPINSLINKLPDNIRRGSVSVAPYLVGQKGQDYIFDLYLKSDLILGMRFHSSICGLGLGKNCVGLVNYRQINELYNEMGLENFKVYVNKKGFEQKLYALSKEMLNGNIKVPSGLLEPWKRKLDLFHSDIKEWLNHIKAL